MNFISMNKTEKVLAAIYLVVQLVILPLILPPVLDLLPVALNLAQMNFVFFCINFVCTVLICRKYLLHSLKAIGNAPGRFAVTVILGLPLYNIATMLIGLLIIQLMPEFYNVNDSLIEDLMTSDFWITALGTVLLAPVTEEVLYRGLIFGSLYRRNKFVAYLVSTAIFAAIHVMGYIGMYSADQLLLCLLQYIPAGICLGWAYARTGTIFAPMVIHAIINAFGVAAMR